MDEPQLAAALTRNCAQIECASPALRTLHDEIWRISGNDGPDLPWSDWIALSALLLDFRPTLIVELGRGVGTSTALFRFWRDRGLNHRIVSICNTDFWRRTTVPHLEALMPIGWAKGVDARMGDICRQDYGEIVGGESRVLVLWDAHGLEIAGTVLGDIRRALYLRPNVIVAHDMRDARYFPNPEPDVAWLREGDVFSTFPQIGPLVRWCMERGGGAASLREPCPPRQSRRGGTSADGWRLLLAFLFGPSVAVRA